MATQGLEGIESYHRYIAFILRRLGVSEQEIDDSVQDTILKTIHYARKMGIQPKGNDLKRILAKSARWVAIDAWRKKERPGKPPWAKIRYDSRAVEGPRRRLDHRELDSIGHDLLLSEIIAEVESRVGHKTGRIFRRMCTGALTAEEVAKDMGLKLKDVKKHLGICKSAARLILRSYRAGS